MTGPDEYTALVNNNYYTNAMAQMHLRFAADIADTLGRERPAALARIAALIGLEADEIAGWRRADASMALPYDAALGIHAQDDSFLSKKAWDFAATPKEHYPLLLNYHPMVIYRHQVCKQADVVLALLLLSDRFTLEDKRRDFDYYEAVTTHDSSLSSCIFSIIASEVGYHDKAYDYFMETARLDLDDTHGNTHYGVHTAAMAGTWMGVSYGFAGMRVIDGALQFAPTLPARWTALPVQDSPARRAAAGARRGRAGRVHAVERRIDSIYPRRRAGRIWTGPRRAPAWHERSSNEQVQGSHFRSRRRHHRHRPLPLPGLEAAGRNPGRRLRRSLQRATQGNRPHGFPRA